MMMCEVLEKFIKEFRIPGGKKASCLFKYRDKLIHDLAPILSNLAIIFPEGKFGTPFKLMERVYDEVYSFLKID